MGKVMDSNEIKLSETGSSNLQSSTVASQQHTMQLESQSVSSRQSQVQPVSESKCSDLHHAKQTDTKETSMVNKVSDRSFPAVIQEEILDSFKTGFGHDTVWKCEGGCYLAHKFVLAMS